MFYAVTPDGRPGGVLGTVELRDGRVVSTPGVAADTVAMLARRTGLSEAEVFARIADRGWSNGQIMVRPDTTP